MTSPFRKVKPIRIGRGILPELTPEVPELDEDTFLEAMDRNYPDIAARARSSVDVAAEVYELANIDPDAFLSDLMTKGRTPDTEIMLQGFGFKGEQIDELFAGVVSEAAPAEAGWKAAWNKLRTATSQFWFQTKDYFFTVLPNSIFIDPIDALPEGRWEVIERENPEYAQQLLQQRQNNLDMRNKFREIGVESREQYEEWVRKHPELKPPPEWEGEILPLLKDNPTLILDPAFIAYIAADSASYMAAFWGATAVVGFATKNPIAGMAAGVVVTTPAQSQDLYQDLLWAGATEQQAAQIAVPMGLLISSVEMMGGLTVLRAVGAMPGMRPFYQLFRRNLQRGVAKSVITEMAKRGLVSFTEIELAEIFEEIIQAAIQDALVKTFDESREVLGGITEIVLRTFISVSPLAFIGGGANVTLTYKQMSAEQRQQIKVDQASLEDAGLPPEQAEMIAFTNFAETPSGQEVIKRAMEEVKAPEIREEVVPMTRQEEELIKRDLVDLKRKLPTAPIEEKEMIRDRIARLEGDLERGEALIVPEAVPVTEPTAVVPEVVEAPLPAIPSTPEEISKTRQTIMAWVKQKGLTQTQYRDIFMEKGGHRQLHLMTPEQLQAVLVEVKVARPRTIKGKRVVTRKTEKKIQTLKDTLIQDKQLTEESFNHIVKQLGLPTTKYESATKFITESEAKSLIRAMNDEAVLAEWDIRVEEALAENPDIKKVVDDLNARSIRTKEVEFDDKPIKVSRGNELRSMRYYVLKLQKELNAPIYDVWQRINMAHLALRQKEQILINKLENSTPEFRAIVGDENALKRIENYIASKHKMGPKAPANITTEEINLANELERQLFQFRNDVRYARFTEAYAGHSGEVDDIARDIPDAPKRAIRRAADIFEGKGASALRTFLDTQEWGVIRSGYNPLSVVKPRLHLYTAKPTTFSKGHIQTREGTEYTSEDRDIMSRYRSYTKQMMGLTDIAPLIRAFDRVFTENAVKLADYKPVSVVLSRGLNEMKGYREDGGFIIHIMERLYAQVASAVFWRPDLVLRNKFQNFAFNPDYHAGLFIDPRNKFMSAERRQWFEVFVAQQRGIEQDYLLYSQKPLPGFDRITKLAHKTSLYPWSDKSNRAEAYFVRMNKIDRALAGYEKDGDINKLINNSGLRDFEARQQAEALELLVLDEVDYGIEAMPAVSGTEAFARYNAQQLVNNVHFLYDRAQRAPAEMGAAGKTLGNIMVFSRSWGERLLLQGNKLTDPKVSAREKILALRIIVGIMVAGMLAGEAYKKITGKSHNPYNPLNILTWTPGGLIVGTAEDISNVIYWITQAAQGNETAMGKLPGLISGAATLVLPFYKNIIQMIDSLTDKKNIDIWAMRKIRELIDDEYELRGGVHEVERTLLEKLQHALLAGKGEPQTPQEKVSDAEEMLGEVIEEDMPFSIEEPDIYDMRKLNSDFGRILKAISPSEITRKDGYSALAEAWVEKEGYETTWKTKPNVKLYKINADPSEGDTFEEYYRQWRLPEEEKKNYSKAYLGNFSRRELEALREYHGLDRDEQEQFLETNPSLGINPRTEWLESSTNANAQLAIWGQTKLYSMDAYNQAKSSITKLDIPDKAVEGFFPSEEVLEVYFKLSDSRRSDVLKKGTTKEIAEMYLEYSKVYDAGTKGAHGRGEGYRRTHPELQQWGEINLGWKPLEGRKSTAPTGVRAFEGLLR